MELRTFSALELGAHIRAGEITPADAVAYAQARIAAFDSAINAFVTRAEKIEMQTADQIVKGPDFPLAGVPMGLKDNICTKGMRTTCASRILGSFTPPYSATAAQRLADRGALCLGKLNLDEFAMGSTSETSCFGAVKNPWDLERAPGGSSGGAAAAVAAGLCWYAIGSDTGGSVRQPAALCGVTGMKPTYGTISRYGLIAYASSLDQMGPIARTAADCAAILDGMTGRDPRDATSVDLPPLLPTLTGDIRGLKIGIPEECFTDGLSTEVGQAVRGAADTLKSLGAVVEPFSLPALAYAVPAYYIIACAEASSNLSRYDGVKYGRRAEDCGDLDELYRRSRTEGFGPEAKKRILLGTFVLSAGYYEAYYQKALQVKAVLKREFDRAFARFDLLLTPVTPHTAPRLGESLADPLAMYLSDVYTVPVNLAGLPALSMPCGFDGGGLPIGAQLIGPTLEDGRVLNAAHAFQLATEFHRQTPEGRIVL